MKKRIGRKRQIMDRYADKIIGILRDKGITGAYDNMKKQVYAIIENRQGDILTFYGTRDGLICNYAVYTLHIPEYLLGKVGKYLSDLNQTIAPPGGFFHIDHFTQCVAFTNLYDVYNLDVRQDLPSFVSFCTYSHDLFRKYEDVFHGLIKSGE